jgi:hypothetical protein
MGFRVRRIVQLLSGVRVNISRSDASVLLDRRSARFTVRPRGAPTTVGLPGTDISDTESTYSTGGEPTRPLFGCWWAARLVLAFLVIAQCASAQSLDADWKFFGGATLDGKKVLTFYDSESLMRQPNGHIEIWIKGLPEPDVRHAEDTADKKAVARVAEKAVKGYVLPIQSVADFTHDQYIMLVLDEDIANGADIQPTIRMLFELNCRDRLSRALSVFLVQRGKKGYSDTPGKWTHAPPETNVAALLKILCPRPQDLGPGCGATRNYLTRTRTGIAVTACRATRRYPDPAPTMSAAGCIT